MKHPDPGSWSNYVRGLLGPRIAAGMEWHLGSGCRKCRQQVAALEALRQVAVTDRRVDPPSLAVTSVKRLHRLHELAQSVETTRVRLILGFDSFWEPSFAGARSATGGDRHLVYQSDELTLDLDLRPSDDAAGLEVRGQVFDADAKPLAEVPAFLAENGRICAYALSGSMGDFRLAGKADGKPRLGLVTGDEQLIDLELPALPDSGSTTRVH